MKASAFTPAIGALLVLATVLAPEPALAGTAPELTAPQMYQKRLPELAELSQKEQEPCSRYATSIQHLPKNFRDKTAALKAMRALQGYPGQSEAYRQALALIASRTPSQTDRAWLLNPMLKLKECDAYFMASRMFLKLADSGKQLEFSPNDWAKLRKLGTDLAERETASPGSLQSLMASIDIIDKMMKTGSFGLSEEIKTKYLPIADSAHELNQSVIHEIESQDPKAKPNDQKLGESMVSQLVRANGIREQLLSVVQELRSR